MNLVTFTGKILNEKCHFCAVYKNKELVGRFYNLLEKLNDLVLSRIPWRHPGAFIHILFRRFLCWFWKINAGWPPLTFAGNTHLFQKVMNFFILLFHKFISKHMLYGYTCNGKTILCLPLLHSTEAATRGVL